MRNRSLVWLALAVLAGVAVSYGLRLGRPMGEDVGHSLAAQRVLADARSPRRVPADFDLTLVVFSDYQCPACRTAAPEMEAAVKRDGRVRVIYREWPIFGPVSEAAAAVALAAHRQGRYIAVHQALLGAASLDDATFRRAVEQAGGDWAGVQSTLAADRAGIAADLRASTGDALALGLRGTPSYLAGPLLIEGGLSRDEFLRAFAQARKAQAERPR